MFKFSIVKTPACKSLRLVRIPAARCDRAVSLASRSAEMASSSTVLSKDLVNLQPADALPGARLRPWSLEMCRSMSDARRCHIIIGTNGISTSYRFAKIFNELSVCSFRAMR